MTSEHGPPLDAVALATQALEYGPGRPHEDLTRYAGAVRDLMVGKSGIQLAQTIGFAGFLCMLLLEHTARLEDSTPQQVLQEIALELQQLLLDGPEE